MLQHQNVVHGKLLNTLMRIFVSGVGLNMLPYYFQVYANLTSK